MQARAALAMAQGDLRAADADYDAVRRALELLLGRYPGAEIEARGDFVPVPPPVAAGVPASLIERRPDLVSAERQVIAAFRLQKAAKLALLPSIAIQVDGGRLSEKLLSLLSLNPTLLHAAIGMEIPIYEGGKLRAQIRIATAEQAGAVAQYGTATLQAFGEVENALTGEVALAERLRFEEQALYDLDETVRLARIRFLSGAGDLLTVLLYQTAQLERHANVIELRNAQLANRIDLHLALGGSFEELAAPIDEDGG
jgi:outer membrane protein TolC